MSEEQYLTIYDQMADVVCNASRYNATRQEMEQILNDNLKDFDIPNYEEVND